MTLLGRIEERIDEIATTRQARYIPPYVLADPKNEYNLLCDMAAELSKPTATIVSGGLAPFDPLEQSTDNFHQMYHVTLIGGPADRRVIATNDSMDIGVREWRDGIETSGTYSAQDRNGIIHVKAFYQGDQS